MNRLLVSALAVAALATVSGAASLDLSYSLAPSGSLWLYDMTLSVDTTSSGWSSGMGWSWIVFGDVPNNETSPLADFAVTSGFPIGPWGQLASSSGGHDGPTLLFDGGGNVVYWVPTSGSDTVSWQGTSAFEATPGSLQFSELDNEGGASLDNFKTMTQVPEPASLLVLGGLVPFILRRRRAR